MVEFILTFISFFGAQGDSRLLPDPVMAFVQLALWFFVALVIIFAFRFVLSLIKGW